jgi:DNA-binding NarL/FixJ family response regulator
VRTSKSLTEREKEVLRLFGEGLTGKQIAANLGITAQMVSKYRKIYGRKLGLTTGHAVVRYAATHMSVLHVGRSLSPQA